MPLDQIKKAVLWLVFTASFIIMLAIMHPNWWR